MRRAVANDSATENVRHLLSRLAIGIEAAQEVAPMRCIQPRRYARPAGRRAASNRSAAHSWQGGASRLRSRPSPCAFPTAAARKAKARTLRRSLRAAAAARAGRMRGVTRTMRTETHACGREHARARMHTHTQHTSHTTSREPECMRAHICPWARACVRACVRASSASVCVCATVCVYGLRACVCAHVPRRTVR